MKIHCVIAGLTLVGASAVGLAEPLRRSAVPAEAAWVVHADCDGLRSTRLGQYLLSEMNRPEVQGKFGAFQAIFNFDPRKDLHGLTLYGVGDKPENAVLMIHADFDAERLATLAKGAKDYKSAAHGSHWIHHWHDDKRAKEGGSPRVYAAMSGRMLMLGQREESIARALDAVDGKVDTLAGSKAFAQLGSVSGSLVEAATHRITPNAADPNAAMLKRVRLLQLQVLEVEGRTRAAVSLEVDNSETAGAISSIAQGLIALAKLREDRPEAMKLANGLSLTNDGAAIRLLLNVSADDVVSALKAHAAGKEPK